MSAPSPDVLWQWVQSLQQQVNTINGRLSLMATQADLDALTTAVQQDNATLTTAVTNINAEIAALKTANPTLDVTGLQNAVSSLGTVTNAVNAIAPPVTPPTP